MTAEQKGDRAEGERSAGSKKINVSVPQVAGGALASVTAAFLGSSLGAAGTLWGAGLTSVVITVGGAVYERSLETTKDRAKDKANRAALNRVRGKPVVGGAGPSASGVAVPPGEGQERTRRIHPVSPSGPGVWQWPGGERVDAPAERPDEPTAYLSAEEPTRELREVRPTSPDPGADGTTVVSPPTGSRIRWGVLAATSAAIFGLGMLVVTGLEGITGKTFSGDGGTTVGQVFRPAAAPVPPAPPERTSERPEPTPTVPPTSETSETSVPEPSETPSAELPTRTGTGDDGNAERPTTPPRTTEESPSDSGSERSSPTGAPSSE